MTKTIREEILKKRKELSNREEYSLEIMQLFLLAFEGSFHRVFIYVSYHSEVETHHLIQYFLQNGITVCCPRVNGQEMDFYEITEFSQLTKGTMGILEPMESCRLMTPENLDDLMILPGSVFSETGDRMGYGAGFYDRYLSFYPCRKVALAFELQVVPKIETKATDIPMDALVTEVKLREWKR